MPNPDYGTNVKITGLEAVTKFLAELPRGTRRAAIAAIGEYILGNEQHGLRHYAPYKFVGRPRAYGKVSDAPRGYFSWKQFRFVMMMIARGIFTPGTSQRTGATADAWESSTTSDGYRMRLFNRSRGAKYITDDYYQARQPALVGHRKLMVVVASNMVGALRAGNAAVNRWLKENRK